MIALQPLRLVGAGLAVAAAFYALLLVHPPALAAQASYLTETQRGSIPVILVAPHGGSLAVPGIAPRTNGATNQETRTKELAEAILVNLESRHGQRAYAVIALFHRRYVDANRAPEEAYQQPAAKPYYDTYQSAIRGYVDEIRRQSPNGGLLIDIHGNADDPGTINRGTRDGLTMQQVLAAQGPEALVGRNSIFGRLQALGYAVFPPSGPVARSPENPAFNSGYTVLTHGSHRPGGVDAIQIEIGSDLRQDEVIGRLADDLADAIWTYYSVYLRSGDRPDSAPLTRDADPGTPLDSGGPVPATLDGLAIPN